MDRKTPRLLLLTFGLVLGLIALPGAAQGPGQPPDYKPWQDLEQWGGGWVAFVRKYLPADKQKQLDAAGGKVDLEFDEYSWKLNDASR